MKVLGVLVRVVRLHVELGAEPCRTVVESTQPRQAQSDLHHRAGVRPGGARSSVSRHLPDREDLVVSGEHPADDGSPTGVVRMPLWSTASTARATVTTYSGEAGSMEISSGVFGMDPVLGRDRQKGKAPERVASGASRPGGIRTPDLRLSKKALYPLSYWWYVWSSAMLARGWVLRRNPVRGVKRCRALAAEPAGV